MDRSTTNDEQASAQTVGTSMTTELKLQKWPPKGKSDKYMSGDIATPAAANYSITDDEEPIVQTG